MVTNVNSKRILILCSLLLALMAALGGGNSPAYAASFDGCADSALSSYMEETECQVLVDLYDSLGGTSWTGITDWKVSADPCIWTGVTCTGDSPPKVATLSLNTKGLTGTLSTAATLSDLTGITSLDLGGNTLTGSIPAAITGMTTLTYINLSGNDLTGTIPNFSGLSGLTTLFLGGNGLTGGIPASLASISGLQYLFLEGNSLSGNIPAELGSSNLQSLILYGNDLDGSIPPELVDNASLWDLNLSGNSLTGSIPPELGNHTNLGYLNLGSNLLTGEIPASLGNMNNLRGLWLQGNSLNGQIPASLGKLSKVIEINLSSNALSGNVPKELAGIPTLESLYVNWNPNLSYAIPVEFTDHPVLDDLRYNETGMCEPTDAAFLSWTSTLTTYTPPAGPPACAPIFADGFESGDVSAWSSVTGSSIGGEVESAVLCKLCVNQASAMVDQYGLKLRVPNRLPRFLADTTPASVTNYHARFYIKAAGLTMENGSKIKLFQGRMGTQQAFFVLLRKFDGKYWLKPVARTDAGTKLGTAWVVLPKFSSSVEVDWKAISSDGYIRLYINDVLKREKQNVDNDTLSIDNIRLGVTQKIKAAYVISGYFWLDAFASDALSFIGK